MAVFSALLMWGVADPSLGASAKKLVISASPASVTIAPGTSVAFTVKMSRGAGFTAPVVVSGKSARPGLALVVAPSPVTSATLQGQLTAGPTTRLGATAITVTAKGGGVTVSVRVPVKVVATLPTAVGASPSGGAGAPGPTPASLALQPGGSGEVVFQTAGSVAGKPISYGAASLPTGLSVVITPLGTRARYVFSATKSMKVGSFSVTLRASQGGVVFMTSPLPVVVGAPGSASSSSLVGTSLVVTASSSTTVASSIVSTSTPTAATTTPTTTPTTSTPSTSTAPSSVAPAAVGDRVIARRSAAEASGLLCSSTDSPLGQNVSVSFVNSGTTPRVMSVITGCAGGVSAEGPAVATIAPGQTLVRFAQINAKFVFRSANDGGLRRAIQVQSAKAYEVSGVMTVSVSCTGPKPYAAQVQLAQGQRVVIADIAPSSRCELNDIDGLQVYWKSWDNEVPNADQIVTVFQRPAGCAAATPSSPSQINAANPCWAEMRFSW